MLAHGGEFESSDATQYRACADLTGSVHRLTRYRRNGRWEVNVAHVPRMPDPMLVSSDGGDEQSVLDGRPDPKARLRRLQLEAYTRYVRRGECTVVELRTICALWFRGLTMRALARRDGVSAAAISSRIERLRTKAPEFYRGWYLLNINRRNRRTS